MLSMNGLSSSFHGDSFLGSNGSPSPAGEANRLSIAFRSALMLAWSFCILGLAILDEVIDAGWKSLKSKNGYKCWCGLSPKASASSCGGLYLATCRCGLPKLIQIVPDRLVVSSLVCP